MSDDSGTYVPWPFPRGTYAHRVSIAVVDGLLSPVCRRERSGANDRRWPSQLPQLRRGCRPTGFPHWPRAATQLCKLRRCAWLLNSMDSLLLSTLAADSQPSTARRSAFRDFPTAFLMPAPLAVLSKTHHTCSTFDMLANLVASVAVWFLLLFIRMSGLRGTLVDAPLASPDNVSSAAFSSFRFSWRRCRCVLS